MATPKDASNDAKENGKENAKTTNSKTPKKTPAKKTAGKKSTKPAKSTKSTAKKSTTKKTTKSSPKKTDAKKTETKQSETKKTTAPKKTTSSNKKSDTQVTSDHDLNPIVKVLSNIENELKRAKLMLQQLQVGKSIETLDTSSLEQVARNLPTHEDSQQKIVEGVYDGYFMIGSDTKKYPVPMNYASKSKLIPGDVLKLRVMTDGKLIYKLIGQADRKYIRATLTKTDDNKYAALSDEGTLYALNQAAVTYYKGKTGDELSIIINNDGVGKSAAIEALIPQAR